MVTVYHMLECNGMDILPYPSHLVEDTKLKSKLSVDGEGSWCLFSIDVRNTYGTPFEVCIERIQNGGHFLNSYLFIVLIISQVFPGLKHLSTYLQGQRQGWSK